MNKEGYKQALQKDYGDVTFSEASAAIDLPPKKFAEEMMACFEAAGILKAIEEREISILASSVSRGDKDWAFLRKLDQAIGALKTHHKPKAFLTDFALKSEDKTPIIEKPRRGYENLDINIAPSDSGSLPFRKSTLTVLYERLGALWHAALQDSFDNNSGVLTRKILEEYKRVVAPGGKIIFDSTNSRVDISTYKNISRVVQDGDANKFFSDMGFKVEFTGNKDGFVILTCPDEKT